ncbi:calcyphosin-like protein isoform X1 [Musca domestica]|uniref:Calcyphosin-like protein isoform X1 n=2 Tax=Musca domestica TaxID=7370 RepID=A0ABM3VAG7_MUSDO|nr:calcyphosin-like protein isoform X1 [Musca domestica]
MFLEHFTWMSFRDDFYSKEATLINRARRELANGLEKQPIDKLRLKCFTRGSAGILSLCRSLLNMENGESKSVNFDDFKAAIKQSGIDCTDDEVKDIFACFDGDNCGHINTKEFVSKLRPPMIRSRLDVIEKAFAKADHSGNGVITVNDLKNLYNVKDHPKYLSGEVTEKQILSEFLSNFDGNTGNLNAKIPKEDFLSYYAGVSASIDNDAYFDLVMRRAYKL